MNSIFMTAVAFSLCGGIFLPENKTSVRLLMSKFSPACKTGRGFFLLANYVKNSFFYIVLFLR